jgi:hypothetical protein
MLEAVCFEMQDSQRNMKTSEKVQNIGFFFQKAKQQSVKQKHKEQQCSSAVTTHLISHCIKSA